MLNLATLLEDTATKLPDNVAVVFGDRQLTYRDVASAAGQVADYLRELGIGPGDTVALTCPNLPYFPMIYFGILETGAAVVPLNVLLKGREVAYHLADSRAKAYFCFEGTGAMPMGEYGRAGFDATPGCEHLVLITADPAAPSPDPAIPTLGQAMAGRPTAPAPSCPTSPDDTAVVLYTSGTTGQPKGAELSHSNMTMNVLALRDLFGRPADGFDTTLLALPLFHSFGQTVQQNLAFASGDTLVLMPRFDPAAALSSMAEHRVSFFAGVPTMYWAMLTAVHAGTVPSSAVSAIAQHMRIAVAGGSSMPVEILREFADRFGVEVREGYGLSETSPVATFNRLDHPPRPGSVGLPIWGVSCKLVDSDWNEVAGPDAVGELAIRGHNVMKGYLHRPAETRQVLRNGWFRTGDLGRRDRDGYYYIVDRVKDMIVRNGMNVYPREVEEVLMTHPAISLAAVVGVPHTEHGEEVKAYVILEAGASLDADDLVDWARNQMAAYKYPRTIEFVASLPMTATGKVLKRELVGPAG